MKTVDKFAIGAAVVLFLLGAVYSASAPAAPMAWGQPMPERCTTTFEWKSPNSYPVHVYKDPTCAKPWAENAVSFWNWFKSQKPVKE